MPPSVPLKSPTSNVLASICPGTSATLGISAKRVVYLSISAYNRISGMPESPHDSLNALEFDIARLKAESARLRSDIHDATEELQRLLTLQRSKKAAPAEGGPAS